MRLLSILLLILLSPLTAGVRLTVSGKEAVLDEALIRCELHGHFLLRHRELTFFNPGKRAAEGELICPLDPGETVTSYAMTVNGVRREGVVVPEKRGRMAYEAIVRQKVDPGIIEVDEVKNEFRTRIFPILSQKQKKVWISTISQIDSGKVTVWPAGFGSPKSWQLEIETRGGQAGILEKVISGKSSLIPERVIDWAIKPNLIYRGSQGDLRQVPPPVDIPPPPKKVELWIDGSVSISKDAMTSLKQLLKTFGSPKITAHVLRRQLTELGVFSVIDGEAPGLIARLEKEIASDMCLPELLPWKNKTDAVIFITDGTFVTGKFDPEHSGSQLHVIDSGAGTSRWLRNAALLSGGGWHQGGGLDSMMGCRFPQDSVIGPYRDILWQSVPSLVVDHSPGLNVIESPVADWLRSKLISARMTEMGKPRAEVEKFNRDHKVMDKNSAMLVLETARQYVRYGFKPPKSDEALYTEWSRSMKARTRRGQSGGVKARPAPGLLELWHERCAKLEKKPPSIHERLSKMVIASKAEWATIIQRFEEIQAEDVQALTDELEALDGILAGGIEKKEIPELKKRLLKLKDLDRAATDLRPLVDVTIGGQVRKPGRYSLVVGATLGKALEAAGGPTAYGAINRVKLYRGGRVYAYNMKLEEHRGVRIFQSDVIEVPQKRWYGNGGGEGRRNPPFVKGLQESEPFVIGEDHPAGFYLEPLDKALSHGNFREQYIHYRESCGWRADFYLDVIELVERRGSPAEARSIIGDLASHMPDHPENLIKAARAFCRLGIHDDAILLCRRAITLEPETYLYRFQLARCLRYAGKVEEAVQTYWDFLLNHRPAYPPKKMGIIPLEELNALIHKYDLDGEKLGVDPAYIRHVPVKVRAVLDWDARQSNLDLIVHHPTLDWVSLSSPEYGEDGGMWSSDIYRGLGPESWSTQTIHPGEHCFSAKFYGDWDESRTSTVTAEIEVTTDFGMPNEKRHRQALRITEKEHKVVTKAAIWPAGWEE